MLNTSTPEDQQCETLSLEFLSFRYNVHLYSGEHKDQNDVKKKSKCKITFYFKAL